MSIIDLKKAAQRLLPPDSILRMMIFAEPDTLSRSIIAKVIVFSCLMAQELGPPSS